MTSRDLQPRELRAAELYGNHWFNGGPIIVGSLRGKAMLVFFWDFTCIHSERTLPYISEWYRRYEELGLVVVGVHTPRFPFGQNPDLVSQAISRLGIGFPVVMDNDAIIWTKYGNREWPGIQLVDGDGFIRYQHVGEGHHATIEHLIQSLLHDTGVREDFPVVMEAVREEDRIGAVLDRHTQDLFAGYLRGSIGNAEGVIPESTVRYEDPGIYFDGRMYLHGLWRIARSSVEVQPGGGHVILQYSASNVHAVLAPEQNHEQEVFVTHDGQPITGDQAGSDVFTDERGQSLLRIDSPRRYDVVRGRDSNEHTLRFVIPNGGISVYAFTFVAGTIPELISR